LPCMNLASVVANHTAAMAGEARCGHPACQASDDHPRQPACAKPDLLHEGRQAAHQAQAFLLPPRTRIARLVQPAWRSTKPLATGALQGPDIAVAEFAEFAEYELMQTPADSIVSPMCCFLAAAGFAVRRTPQVANARLELV
jgi:hypothetical protein